MTTQENSLVSSDQKASFPALTYTINKIWPTEVDVRWELRDYLTHYGLGDATTGMVHYVGPAIPSFRVRGLKPDTEYRFSVGGYQNNEIWHTEPAFFTFRTKSPVFPIWTTAVSRTRINLSWDGGDIGITLEMDGVKVGDFPPNVKYHGFGGLTPGKTYKFRGKLDLSDEWVELDVKTLLDKPTPPSYLGKFEHTLNSVTLHWGPGTVDGGKASYRVRRDEELLEETEDTGFRDLTPEQGRTYVYSVCTVDDRYNESDRVTLTLSFEDHTSPSEVSNLRTTDLSVQVLWDPAYDSSGHVKYNVYLEGVHKGTTEETAFSLTELESGKLYQICVQAEDASENKSEKVCVTYPAIGIPRKHKQ